MENELRQNMLALCARYMGATGCGITTLGKNVRGEGVFFQRLESGSGFTAKTYDEVVRWFADNWPGGAEWPADLPRPSTAEAAAE